MPRYAIIVALDANGLIGDRNKLPWMIPEDLAYFKRMTLGHSVVMGRRTYESIGKALPHRNNYVLTSKSFISDDTIAVNTITKLSTYFSKDELVFVIGGREVFQQFVNVVDLMYLTRIRHAFTGNTYFPEIDWSNWILVNREENNSGIYDLAFEEYKRNC
ncbi:MAG: dihydrofolate reductase [Candidatus Cloacimonetes bacterium]|nr:dihydrofolate reductase [Candidatus Cloacimonadota bacterium]